MKKGDPLRVLTMSDGKFATVAVPASGSLVIGRSQEAQIRLDSPSVSRRHAILHVGDGLGLEDLGSSNGTLVRGVRIEPGQTVMVVPGEAIKMGTATLIIQRDLTRVDERHEERELVDGTDILESDWSGLVVQSPVMRQLCALVQRIAKGNINVLVVGETGVGKEVITEQIHKHSPRKDEPLLRLNCAAISPSLLESELFGHEKGAFTGASRAKPGLLETGDKGTVFLDEIGDLPLPLQAKLLRVVEDGQLFRVGAVKARRIDVRFVAATHRNLELAVTRGEFRQDLLFRLNAIVLVVPPLRERRDDILPLTSVFVARAAQALRRGSPPSVDAAAGDLLCAHDWPGNVRELKNVIERAVLLCSGEHIGVEHLPADMTRPLPAMDAPGGERDHHATATANTGVRPRATTADLTEDVKIYERRRVLDALTLFGHNQTQAAHHLGISRRTLITKMEKHNIPRPRKRRDAGKD